MTLFSRQESDAATGEIKIIPLKCVITSEGLELLEINEDTPEGATELSYVEYLAYIGSRDAI